MQTLAPDLVIVGEEVRTSRGELLAYFLTETIEPGLSPEETIARIRAQGGVVGISHPLDRIRRDAMGREAALTIIDQVDMLEVFNARSLFPEDNAGALALAEAHGKLKTAGSDAHTLYELGRATMRTRPFDGAQDFLAALAGAQIVARPTTRLIHFASRWAAWRKRLRRLALTGRG
jgi:predicted metal-dependent phosphoesterase TrpH